MSPDSSEYLDAAHKVLETLVERANEAARFKYVGVCGSRNWDDEKTIRRWINANHIGNEVYVHGDAKGADQMFEEVSKEFDADIIRVPALWDVHGRNKAGFHRNSIIVDLVVQVVAFWDGKSRGTLDTIRKSEQAGLHVDVVYQSEPIQLDK